MISQKHLEAVSVQLASFLHGKNTQYGDAHNKVGIILSQLYPDGIAPDQYVDALTIVRMLDKFFRLAAEGASEDTRREAWKDLAGYGLLRHAYNEAGREVPTDTAASDFRRAAKWLQDAKDRFVNYAATEPKNVLETHVKTFDHQCPSIQRGWAEQHTPAISRFCDSVNRKRDRIVKTIGRGTKDDEYSRKMLTKEFDSLIWGLRKLAEYCETGEVPTNHAHTLELTDELMAEVVERAREEYEGSARDPKTYIATDVEITFSGEKLMRAAEPPQFSLFGHVPNFAVPGVPDDLKMLRERDEYCAVFRRTANDLERRKLELKGWLESGESKLIQRARDVVTNVTNDTAVLLAELVSENRQSTSQLVDLCDDAHRTRDEWHKLLSNNPNIAKAYLRLMSFMGYCDALGSAFDASASNSAPMVYSWRGNEYPLNERLETLSKWLEKNVKRLCNSLNDPRISSDLINKIVDDLEETRYAIASKSQLTKRGHAPLSYFNDLAHALEAAMRDRDVEAIHTALAPLVEQARRVALLQ